MLNILIQMLCLHSKMWFKLPQVSAQDNKFLVTKVAKIAVKTQKSNLDQLNQGKCSVLGLRFLSLKKYRVNKTTSHLLQFF